MKITSRLIGLAAVLLLSLCALGASAQKIDGEPSLAQIYQAANNGDLPKAQAMIDQVLKAHPNSAKAHYVKAELAARDNNFNSARDELAAAEKLAPGLPFARHEAVQALRNELARPPSGVSRDRTLAQQLNGGATERSSPGFPWGTFILVAAVLVVGVAVLRARVSARARETYGDSYGSGPAPYGQPGPMYPPPGAGGVMMPPNGTGYGQPSMGSSIMRGLGTGLAVGAGALAAQELGRRMFSHEGQQAVGDAQLGGNPSMDAIDEGMRRNLNVDMGGENFGVTDQGGWDDGASGGDVGGADWDT